MYTSQNKRLQKHLIGSIIAALFCGLFAAVYEAFSFGVYSYFMLFAFAVPLLGCALPYSILIFRDKKIPHPAALRLWESGAAALTVGSIVQGIIEIYGTTNHLVIVYAVAGAALCISGAALWLIKSRKSINGTEMHPV